MPAPLAVDWDKIRSHALQCGVRQAARDFGLKEDCVMQRSRREKWLAQAPTPPPTLPPTVAPQPVSGIRTATQATLTALQRHGDHSRLNIARAVRKGSIAAARMDGTEILERAPALKALAATGDTIHGWTEQREADRPTLFRLDLRIQAGAESAPVVIDGACEVSQVPQPEG